MTQSSDQLEEQDREWFEKTRFQGISEERKQKIKEEEKEIKDAEEEVNRHLKAIDEDPECEGWTEEKAKKVEEEKAKKLKSIYK